MMDDRSAQLVALCQQFIADNEIGHAEVIYQNDLVIESAYTFIEDICNIVGYAQHNEESQ
jgi:hypothetical protein